MKIIIKDRKLTFSRECGNTPLYFDNEHIKYIIDIAKDFFGQKVENQIQSDLKNAFNQKVRRGFKFDGENNVDLVSGYSFWFENIPDSIYLKLTIEFHKLTGVRVK